MGGWDVEGTVEFETWFVGLTEYERKDVIRMVELLVRWGPQLRHPHSSGIQGSRHPHMRELRIQHRGRPLRVL